MATILPSSYLNLDFVKMGQASGANYPDESSKMDQRVTFARASSGWRFSPAGILEPVGVNQPRFDYNPSTLQPRGILIEEGRANEFLYSNNLQGAAWNLANGSCTSNTVSTILGNISEFTASASGPFIYQYITPNSTSTRVISLYAASSVGSYPVAAYLICAQPPIGVVASTTMNLTPGITENSRFYFTGVPVNSTGLHYIQIGAGTQLDGKVIYIGGVQCEAGTFPTSPIITTTLGVTRQADSAIIYNLSPWYNHGQGTMISEGLTTAFSTAFTVNVTAGFSNPDASYITHYLSPYAVSNGCNAGNIFARTGIATFNVATGPFATGAAVRTSTTWTTTGIVTCSNGGVFTSSATTQFPNQPTKFELGGLLGGSPLNGTLKQVQYYPQTVSNLVLKQMSKPF